MLMQIAAQLFNTPLYAERGYAEIVASVLADRLGVQPILAAGDMTMVSRPARSPMVTEAGIMVLPIVGALMHRGSMMDAMSGAQSYSNVQNMLAAAMSESDIKAILLDVDSPGGQVGGCLELAQLIKEARGEKPIWAIANTACYSAAYALACSATKLFASPSAGVGSIGVITMHVDMSKAIEKKGIVTTLVYRGSKKPDGHPTLPLSDSARAEMESRVEEFYEMFVEHVAANRGLDADAIRATEAGCFGAAEAKELGLVDDVQSLSATMAALQASLEAKAPSPTIVHHRPRGASDMTTPAAQTPAPIAGISAEAHAAAIATARAEGYAEGRAHAGKIMGTEAAQKRPKLAAELASDAAIKPERAESLLGASAEEKAGGKLDALMEAARPAIGAGGSAPDPQEARKKELQEAAQRVSATRYGTKTR